MIIDNQLIITIIQYTGVFGLFLSGILALVINDKKKKLIFLFLMYVFAGILSFALYSGFTFFTAGFVFTFFFILLYIAVIQWEARRKRSHGQLEPEDGQTSKRDRQNGRTTTKNVLNIVLPLLLCSGLGYLIFNSTYGYLAGTGNQSGDQPYNISFTDPGLVIKSIFSSYGPVVVILVSALFITFLWFIVIIKSRDRQKNGEEE